MSACRTLATTVANHECSFYISNDGSVFSIGYSYYHAHGHEQKDVKFTKKITTLTNIKYIACGDHTVCLDNDGNVFTFGDNRSGQLGIGVNGKTLEFTHVPQKVKVPPCIEVSCGSTSTICLTIDGLVYSFGGNGIGQLGLGNNEDVNSPQLIESLKDVEFVECSLHSTFCKTVNNEIFCWGSNVRGILGLGNEESQNAPILCSSLANKDIIDIKSNGSHALALTSNGDVFSSGDNEDGQLGRKTDVRFSSLFEKIDSLSEITRIECGYNHSICIDSNKDIYLFGSIDNNENETSSFMVVTSKIKSPIKHPSISNVIDVSKGGLFRVLARTSDNEIYSISNSFHTNIFLLSEQNEDIWGSNINIPSKAKSARSVLPKPNEDDNSPKRNKK